MAAVFPVSDAEGESWTWTVVERWEKPRRGVTVIGEHSGASPAIGKACVVRDGVGNAPAVVAGLERFHHRKDGKFTHHSWGLLLGEVALDDVRVGAIVEHLGPEGPNT
jgi:hypothetical protein